MVVSAKEKSKRGCIREWGWGGVAVSGGVDEKDLIKQVTFAWRAGGGKSEPVGIQAEGVASIKALRWVYAGV